MFCSNCGKEIDDKAAVCIYCGVATKNANTPVPGADTPNGLRHHDIPKCRKCGYIGEFQREKMFRKKDWVIGLLTLFFGFGLIYLIIIAIMRYDEKSRETICPHCGAVDSAMEVY